MYLAHHLARCPMAQIGQFFGRRTHTSVSHSCRRLQELLPGSPTLQDQVTQVRQRLAETLREDCA
jgi:chromosomal replication initiation ATPase DnaA